mgnify:FL=1
MATNLRVKDLSYNEYERLLKAEDTLEELGYTTASHMLHDVIKDIKSEIEWIFSNDHKLQEIADTIQKAHRDFRQIVIRLNDYSIWDFAWFGFSMTVLVLSNQTEGRTAFIWEVKEVLVGDKIVIDGKEMK